MQHEPTSIPRNLLLRRVILVLAAVALYRLGCWIPVPGVDVDALAAAFGMRSSIERVSIMGLGVNPLLSALIVAELAMIAMPSLRRMAPSAGTYDVAPGGWIVLAALALAGLQANGIAVALEEAGPLVPSPGLAFRAGVVVSMVAGTAALIWVAALVTRYGLGSGFLLLLAAPYLMDFAAVLAAQMAVPGAGSETTVPLTLAVLAAAAAALAFVARSNPQLVANGQLFWPPILAYAVGPWIVALVVYAVAPQSMTDTLESAPGGPVRIVVASVLTAAFFFWRAASLGDPPGTERAAERWIVPAVLVGLVAALETVISFLPIPLAFNGRSVVIIVVFALTLLPGFCRVQASECRPAP